MEYTDLNLHISPGADGGYNISARTDDGGGSESELHLPIKLEDMAGVVFGVAQTIRGERPDVVVDASGVTQQPRDFGAKLYGSLIHGEIQSLLDQTLGALRDKRDSGIRIRLTMDLKGAGMSEVASLPWELIAKDPSNLPLVVSKQTVLVRSPNVLKPTAPTKFEPPLRILVIRSNPKGTADLNLDEEQTRISKSWGSLTGVHVDFVDPTFDEIREYLADEDPHVVHYMGHGDYDAKKGGALILEDANGEADWVGGDRLKMLFSDERLLRLVFLNACKTATSSNDTGVDPFASVAETLISVGIPAVVAMQFPISDTAAIDFADTFYRRIAAGDPVDTAVAEARRRLFGGDQAEWATPVLFMRSKDGVLFERVLGQTRSADVNESNGATPDTANLATQESTRSAGTGFSVFLAAPTDSLRPRHRQIAAGLVDDGVSVVANIPEPYEDAAHAKAVREAVRKADLCVHLLGDRPGEPLGEETGRTYPLEQLKIALESARSQLILMPEEFEIDAIENVAYREYLQGLTERSRDPERLEFMRIGPQQMLDEVRAKRRKLTDAKKTSVRQDGQKLSACLDLHTNDLGRASDLVKYLNEREVGILLQPSADNTPSAAMDAFARNLESSPLFLVVFGDVAREWVCNRLEWANKLILRKGLSTRIGVYITEPEKSADQLRFPPLYEVISGVGVFDPAAMDALLAKTAEQL